MAERGWLGGLLDETAKLPQGIAQLVVDAVTRQPRTDPTQPVVTPGPGGLLDLTPVPGLTEAYKATDDVGKGGYEGGKAVGTYLSGLLGIIPAVGAVRKAGPIRAYHGSPHSFDKFDLNKIGTGEGAQAYGHGLYFAGNEDVAKSYKRAGPAAYSQGDEINKQMNAISREMDKISTGYRQFSDPVRGKQLADQYDALMQKRSDLGHMYEVGIHADPARVLDWDRPFSQQSPEVQAALREIHAKNQNYYDKYKDRPGPQIVNPADYSGERLYKGAASGDAIKATETLQQLGIPGIKYLDQGSRGPATIFNVGSPREGFGPYTPFTSIEDAKKHLEVLRGHGFKDAEISKQLQPQTSNYVVFDPKIIEIMRKYGLLPVAAGGAAAAVPGLLNQEKQY